MKTDIQSFVKKVAHMRTWQRAYFRQRGTIAENPAKKHAYEVAREAEQNVDRMLQELMSPQESLL